MVQVRRAIIVQLSSLVIVAIALFFVSRILPIVDTLLWGGMLISLLTAAVGIVRLHSMPATLPTGPTGVNVAANSQNGASRRMIASALSRMQTPQ